MGCKPSKPALEEQSYLKPLNRFSLSFYVNLSGSGMKNFHNYDVWREYLTSAMQAALDDEWIEKNGPSLNITSEIPCEDVQIVLMKSRRGYTGVLEWTSLDCELKYIAEYFASSIVQPSVDPNPMLAFNVKPKTLWSGTSQKIEHSALTE